MAEKDPGDYQMAHYFESEAKKKQSTISYRERPLRKRYIKALGV
jgi:hypothetical protein